MIIALNNLRTAGVIQETVIRVPVVTPRQWTFLRIVQMQIKRRDAPQLTSSSEEERSLPRLAARHLSGISLYAKTSRKDAS